jgi:hypothetical protein
LKKSKKDWQASLRSRANQHSVLRECTLKNISVDGKLCIMANGLVENVVVEDKKYGEFVPADMQNPNLAPYLKIRAFDHL